MYKKWIFLAVPLASLVLFAMPAGAAQPPSNQDVTVTNDAAHAIPTVAQGTTNVAGTVNVGNFPATQAVSGTVNVGNLPAIQNVQITPAHPVTLQAAPGLNGQPITHQRYLLGKTSGGGSYLSGQLAIGSITVADRLDAAPRLPDAHHRHAGGRCEAAVLRRGGGRQRSGRGHRLRHGGGQHVLIQPDWDERRPHFQAALAQWLGEEERPTLSLLLGRPTTSQAPSLRDPRQTAGLTTARSAGQAGPAQARAAMTRNMLSARP